MRAKILLVSILFLLIQPSTAQLVWKMEDINVDSLQKILPGLKGIESVDALNKLSLALCRNDPDSSISIARHAIALSEMEEYQKGQGDGYFNLGMTYAFRDSLRLSIINYLYALRIYEGIEPGRELAETFLQLAFMNWIAGRFSTAYKYGKEALHVYQRISNYKGEAYASYALSHFYNFSVTHHYDSAISYLDHALDILNEHPDKEILFLVCQNYGNSVHYKWWGDEPGTNDLLYEAIDWYFKAYENILQRHDSGESVNSGMSCIVFNIGMAYVDTDVEENVIKGYDFVRKAKSIIDTTNPNSLLMMPFIYIKLAHEKIGLGKYEAGIELLHEGIKFSERKLSNLSFGEYEDPFDAYNAQYFLRYNKYRMHNELYNLFNDRGDYQNSLEQYQLKTEIVNEISRGENQKLVALLEAESENEKTENEIALLARDNELKDIKVNQSRILNIGMGILFIILIFIGLLFIRQNKLRSEHKSTLLEQKLLRLQMNPHFIFNALSNIMDFIEEKNTDNATRYLSSFSRLLRVTLESSRKDNILLSQEIDGLKNYLELQKLRYENKFEYSIYVDDRLDPEEVMIPPMLIQPFIENAIEHGIRNKETTGHIIIRFLLKDNMVTCEVEDDGIGREKAWETEYKKRRTHKSLATSIIRDRIQVINKKMKKKIRLDIIDLKSQDNKAIGTKVVLDLPVG